MTATSALYGMALDLLAQFYLGAGRLREAEHLWAEAVKVGRAVHGEAGDQVLVVTNSLATVLSMTGREEEAGKILEDVVVTAERINSPNLSAFLVNLGLVRLKQGLSQEARLQCERARSRAQAGGDTDTVREAQQCLDQLESVVSVSRNKT